MNDLVTRLRDRAHEERPMPKPFNLLLDAAERISQQDAELERLRRELADVRDNLAEAEKDTHYWRVEYDKARKAAFIEAAEIATATATDVRNGDRARFTASHIAMALKKKAEETRT